MAFRFQQRFGKQAPPYVQRVAEMAALDLQDLYLLLQLPGRELTDEEAARALAKHGLNQIPHEQSASWGVLFFRCFKNPFVTLLLILAVVSSLTAETFGALVIAAMVLASVLLRVTQEYRAVQAADRLRALVATKTTVARTRDRNLEIKEIPIDHLVPGDIVHLSAGDMIPADVRILSSRDLFVSQAALTGESLPVEKRDAKTADPIGADRYAMPPTGSPFDLPCIGFMGTNVVSGIGTAVVIATGPKTYFGAMAQTIAGHRSATGFDFGIRQLTWLLIRLIIVLTPFVFVVNGYMKGDWAEAFFFSMSVAVGLTPEMLPMIVTANLARGAVALSKQRAIVKRLNSIQDLGAMQILCADKTGTLTRDHVVLEKNIDIFGAEKLSVLKYAFLNSNFQTGLRNLLDYAVLEAAQQYPEIVASPGLRKIDEIPFDFVRRRMSVILESSPGRRILITKGAVEELSPLCRQVQCDDKIRAFTPDLADRARITANRLNADGFRVVAVAYREFTHTGLPEYSKNDENAMTLAGYIAFFDPPKEETSEALALLQKKGIRIKILTGDNEIVTRKMCEWVGLEIEGSLLGAEVDLLSARELAERCQRANLFCKITPLQKSRIISSLRSSGNIVGYLGDGINDAPALREADVGISVDSSVDVAKESADIILLEKDLMVLANGITEGRKTFGNISKYIKMTASSNLGNVLTIVCSSFFLPFLPLLPLQILVQNLLYDISQTTIPFDSIDEEYTQLPRRWDIRGIGRFMLIFGPVSSLFDLFTFCVLWKIFPSADSKSVSLFQSGWFIECLLSQVIVVHVLRTRKIPIIESTATLPLLISTVLCALAGCSLVSTSLGNALGFTTLPFSYSYWLILILGAYLAVAQLIKQIYVRAFGEWF
jgi:Mg2+-importing ATPase